MPDDPLDTLAALAAPPLGHEPANGLRELAGVHGEDLARLLGKANGFYAFESALHVFPSGTSDCISLELWNDWDLWRRDYDDLTEGMVFFAEDVFGSQFVFTEDAVGTFDPETGEVSVIAPDLSSWGQAVLADYDVLTGYPLGHEWQRLHGEIPAGQRLLPKVPFVLGGGFDTNNLYLADAVDGMRARGNLALQVRDLPDGAKIRYRIVE